MIGSDHLNRAMGQQIREEHARLCAELRELTKETTTTQMRAIVAAVRAIMLPDHDGCAEKEARARQAAGLATSSKRGGEGSRQIAGNLSTDRHSCESLIQAAAATGTSEGAAT